MRPSTMTLSLSAALVAALASTTLPACGGDATPPATSPAPLASMEAPPAVTPEPATATRPAPIETIAAAPLPAPPPAATTPALVWKDMATPESVFYDAQADRYLVSNINGKPLDVDNNGFISELSPDGKVTKLKFIEGGGKVTLNAPKGITLAKGVLYIADIDHVRMFDAKTGAAKGAVKVAGASFLNDVTSAPDGTVYVTDSGLKQGAADFEPTGSDAIYAISGGVAKVVAKSTELNRPNGILWTATGLVLNSFGSNEVFRVDPKYAEVEKARVLHDKTSKTVPAPIAALKLDVTKLPEGGSDGLVDTGDGLLVSSWGGKAIYRGKLGGTFEPVLQSMSAPADIAFDSKRKHVLVPRFMSNVVEAYPLK